MEKKIREVMEIDLLGLFLYTIIRILMPGVRFVLPYQGLYHNYTCSSINIGTMQLFKNTIFERYDVYTHIQSANTLN